MTAIRRDVDAVKSKLIVTENQQVICKTPMRIQIPVRFSEIGLAQVGADNNIYGMFAIITDTGEYCVWSSCAMIPITPAKTVVVEIEGVSYYEFHFDAKQIMIPNLTVIKSNKPIFKVLSEIFFAGKVPYYMNADDVSNCFDTVGIYAGSRVGSIPELFEVFTSVIAREAGDKTKYRRVTAQSMRDFEAGKIGWVGMESPEYAVTNTFNRFAGGYFDRGATASLVSPNQQLDIVEKIIRE